MMRTSLQSAFNRRQGAWLVSYVLLFLITFSSTAVHTHGNLPANSQRITVNLATSDGPGSTGGPQRASDCVVCQFQRNLSSTALFNPVLVLAPVTSPATSTAPIVSYLSTHRTAGRGRAPPLTS
jgi:hypothetical protein